MKKIILFFSVLLSSILSSFAQKDSVRNSNDYYYNIGVEKLQSGYFIDAIRNFTKAIKLNPSDKDAYYNRGIAILKLGIKDSACSDWSTAIYLGDTSGLKLINKYCDSLVIVGKDTCHTKNSPVMKHAKFKGGDNEKMRFIRTNIHYPSTAKVYGIMGEVQVSFIVEKTGELTDVKAINKVGGGCDEEAVRVIKLMPPWEPAVQCGQKVREQFTIPISYMLK